MSKPARRADNRKAQKFARLVSHNGNDSGDGPRARTRLANARRVGQRTQANCVRSLGMREVYALDRRERAEIPLALAVRVLVAEEE